MLNDALHMGHITMSSIGLMQVDGLNVTYIGEGEDDTKAATLRSNHPAPADCPLYYFEVEVVSRGEVGDGGAAFTDPWECLDGGAGLTNSWERLALITGHACAPHLRSREVGDGRCCFDTLLGMPDHKS